MMASERKLDDVVMGQELWAEATTELFREGWEVGDQAEHYGRAFLLALSRREISHNELKRMTKDANRLEKEAIEASAGDIEKLADADYIEAVGRRLAHHALGYALRTRRSAYR